MEVLADLAFHSNVVVLEIYINEFELFEPEIERRGHAVFILHFRHTFHLAHEKTMLVLCAGSLFVSVKNVAPTDRSHITGGR